MDLNTVETYVCPDNFQMVPDWQPGHAWLGGGTWLFSEPQPNLKTLIDLRRLGWSELEITTEDIVIGATCPLSKLLQFPWPSDWSAMQGLQAAVLALAASVKVTHQATVGGNLCLALSVGTLAPVLIVLEAIYEIWHPKAAPRFIPARAFQTGLQRTVLQPGEVLRRVRIPKSSLTWQVDFQRLGIAATDPALSIVVGAYNPAADLVRFGLAGCVAAPKLLEFSAIPNSGSLEAALPLDQIVQDARASAYYRLQITQTLMQRFLQKLPL